MAAGATYMGRWIPPVTDGTIVTQTDQYYFYKQNCDAIAAAIETNRQVQDKEKLHLVTCDPTCVASLADDNRWMKTIGGSDSDGAWSICRTSDEGYVLVGYTFSFGSGMSDVFLCKIDQQGNELWSKTVGGSGFEVGYDVCETGDHGFLITGYTTSIGAGSRDVLVIKTDSQGNLLWEKSFGGPDIDIGFSAYETSDQCYVVCGSTKSFGNHSDDVYIVMMNEKGDLIWDTVWSDEEPIWGNDVIETEDGALMVLTTVGDWFRPGWADRDIVFLQYEKDGSFIFNKTVPETPGNTWNSFNCGEKIIRDHTGGYAIAGRGDILESDASEVYFLKTDETGEKVFDKRYGEGPFYSFGRSICLDDEGYTLCGYDMTLMDYETDVYVLNVDGDGEVIWKRLFGGMGSNWGLDICNGFDDGYVIIGQTKAIDGAYDIVVFKTDEDGMVSNIPDIPGPPVGPSRGFSGRSYSYTASTLDVDDDQVFYLFNWSDGNDSGWLGPFDSGEVCEAFHIWGSKGVYEIKVKAKDIFGYESEWSDPLSVRIPKNRCIFSMKLRSDRIIDKVPFSDLLTIILGVKI